MFKPDSLAAAYWKERAERAEALADRFASTLIRMRENRVRNDPTAVLRLADKALNDWEEARRG